MLKVGEILRDARKKNRLSQEDVAGAARLTVKTLQRLEKGQGNPTIGTLADLAAALKISIGKIIGAYETPPKEEDPKPSPPQMKHLIEAPAANLQHRPLALVLERFVSETPDVRASTLAILYKDETISLPYLRPHSAPSKPSQVK